MKRRLCIVALLVLAAQLPLLGYDMDPASIKVVPEAIWAAATGGGTWVTELQITNYGDPVVINAWLYYDGGSRGPFELHAGLAYHFSVRFSNVLETIDALDPDPNFSYYGRVGALWVEATGTDPRIQIQARTLNGNYGKAYPGLTPLEGTTVAWRRSMVIQDIVMSPTYRTVVGVFNTSATETHTFMLWIYEAGGGEAGWGIEMTLPPHAFKSFNPFTLVGAEPGTYENCWLKIEGDPGSTAAEGVMCFGSVANNFTNDTYALIPMFHWGI